MKWPRNSRRAALVLTVLAAALVSNAGLPQWLEDVPALPRFDGVFFRPAEMPGGPVPSRRPPAETRATLARLTSASPNDAELRALAGRKAEERLDFAYAEAEWKRFADLSPDRAAGQLALADFYHRRLRPQDEFQALNAAAMLPSPQSERFTPANGQRAWQTFDRAAALVEAHALAADTGTAVHRARIARYPAEPAAYRQFLDFALARREFALAEEAIAAYEKRFPADRVFLVSARARLAERRGAVADALAVYDRAFEPLWPPELVKEYFGLLQRSRNLRTFLQRARAAQAANPAELNAAVRIFYYFQQQGNLAAARRALIEFKLRREARKSAWAPDELLTLARLLEATQTFDEAARAYYGAYTTAAAAAPQRETALAGIINLLLSAPEQAIEFGSGNLSFYRDVAAMDPYPGFLNGIASLLLNSADPAWRFADADTASLAYFHRTRAAELLALFDSRYPNSAERSRLHARLIEAYALYGANDGVISAARRYLAAFPHAPRRTDVAMLMADAFARMDRTTEEFAAYDAALKELGARAEGVPIGTGARSPEYARVLDRYIARLLSMKRPMDAVRLLRGELDRNPNDPGLYERLAAFLEQNRLDAQIEQVYQTAIKQFQSRSWYDKLARWYVRRNYSAGLDRLSREVVAIFSGTEVEQYIAGAVGGATTAMLYRQINLYAHERFPYNLRFVHNLLRAYRMTGSADPAAWERLLRSYWYYDDTLRPIFFGFLSQRRLLDAEVRQAREGPPSPAATRFAAEAETWRCHFEDAAPLLDKLAAVDVASSDVARRAASLDRSLAAFDARKADDSIRIEERLSEFAPRDTGPPTRIGEIRAERDQYDRARPYWNRIAEIEPGRPDGYLEAATIFWDYFQFDDALRLLAAGRAKLARPELFAYETGAIYENKRDYARAIEEYAKDLAPGSQARARLVQLARRPAHRAPIDKLTSARTAGAAPDTDAVALRMEVLEAQNRRQDIEPFLLALAARASSAELLTVIQGAASRNALPAVEERVLERQIAVTADPIERTQLRLSLMRFYEARRDAARARQTIEALYGEQPLILGVVRATVDFYWRNKLPANAVETLVRAAGAANAGLKTAFTFEAASKASESGDYAQARTLLAGLLKQDPFHAGYLAAMAGTYARQGDDAGLRTFYENTLFALRSAPLSPDESKNRIAAMRRGFIPVLTRQKDYVGGIDQYIEIIKSYPEDEALARESAAYATEHGQRERLLAYFQKATAESPKDSRWPLALARIHTAFEDFPSAIASYNAAAGIRPDRADILTARASLEERLMRFDEALRSYTKLYDLTYRNPEWMRKVAETHARRGDADAAAKALRAALIEGRPERAEPFFEAARILESWSLLPQARTFAERGVELAGGTLLSDPDYASGARTYARVLTRLRAHEQAYARLVKTAGPDLEAALGEIGATVSRYFTPEEKTALEAWLGNQRAPALFALVQAAGLADLEVRWRFEALLGDTRDAAMHESRLVQLQQRRMRFQELGRQLEEYWKVRFSSDRDRLLLAAADNYGLAGDDANELRVLALKFRSYNLAGPQLERYFELLLANDPKQIAAIAGTAPAGDQTRDAAANFAMASGNAALALEAVEARGRGLPPVWARAYTGLAGLYYADSARPVDADFRAAIGGGTIGDRLGKPVDRNMQLAGGDWFYYGTAYGEYLAATKRAGADDYLPAILEGASARAPAYYALAEYYREARQFDLALAEYRHALEIDAARPEIHDRMAVILGDQGKRPEATAEWRAAFQGWRAVQDGMIPANFWAGLGETLDNAGRRNLLAPVREDADRALRTYFRRSGSYRAEPLLGSAFAAGGIEWVLDLGRAAADELALLSEIVEKDWLPESRREPVYQRILEVAAAQQAHTGALPEWQARWIGHLLKTRQVDRARAAFDGLPEEARAQLPRDLEVRIAAQAGTLDALLARYAREPEKMPPYETLRASAAALRAAGDAANARRALDFVYTRQLEAGDRSAANFLGLAEIRLEEGNVASAMALLRRMALVSGEPFENLDAAADLLARTGRQAEAREFRQARVRAVPWDYAARAKLGDVKVASMAEAPYEDRVQAARQAKGGRFGSAELDLLAGGAIDAAQAERPFFYHARIEAAARAADNAIRMRLYQGALEIAPNADAPRLPLMRSALSSGAYQRAISAMAPFPLAQFESEAPEETGEPWWARRFLSETPFSAAERAEIARSLAQAHARLNRLRQALMLYRAAIAIEPSAQAEAGLREAQAAQERLDENARRRPLIAAGFQQERLVLPRMLDKVGAR